MPFFKGNKREFMMRGIESMDVNKDLISVDYYNDENIILKNIINGRSIEINSDTLTVIQYMTKNTTIEECMERFGLSKETLNFVISELEKIELLGKNKNYTVNEMFEKTDLSFFDANDFSKKDIIRMIGIPYDGAVTGAPGCGMAPDKLRKVSSGYSNIITGIDGCVRKHLPNISCFSNKIVDLGNVLCIPGEASKAIHERIKKVFLQERKNRDNPIIAIGGDHSITYPILKTFRDDIIFVKIDAHYDMNPIINGIINHANFINAVKEIDNVKKIIHLGVREAWNPRCGNLPEYVWSTEQVKNGMYKPFLEKLTVDVPRIYISIDIDVMDPRISPGTGFTIPFGLQVKELIDIVSFFNTNSKIVGVDIVEFNPLLDRTDSTLYATLDIVSAVINILGKSEDIR